MSNKEKIFFSILATIYHAKETRNASLLRAATEALRVAEREVGNPRSETGHRKPHPDELTVH